MNTNTQMRNDQEMTAAQIGSWHEPASPVTLPIRRGQYSSKAAAPLLSDEQQLAFIRQVQIGNTLSLRKMIANNMHLVVDLVRPYNGRDLPLLKLIKEGIEGLTHALKHFVPEGDTSFSSYASLCIYHRIELAILTMDHPAAAAHAESAAQI